MVVDRPVEEWWRTRIGGVGARGEGISGRRRVVGASGVGASGVGAGGVNT